MSLTSCLKEPASAISRFLAEHLPSPQAVLADYRKRLGSFAPPIKPKPGPGSRADYRMIGHTIDHRLRITLGAPTGQPIAAGVVRAVLDDDGWPSPGIIQTVCAAGEDLLEELRACESGQGQPLALEEKAEERLVRLCHVASSFEAIFRHGGWVRGNSLGFCKPDADLDDFAAAVPAYVVDDIRAQMALAASPGPFAALRGLPASARICGPVFDGSRHLGGADADFILDGHLIDCKATVHPDRMGRSEIYQLAGYLVLDYADAYGINTVGLYLSRQGASIDWSVQDFLDLTGCRLTLPELRSACQYALTDGSAGTPPPPESARRPAPRPRNAPGVQDSLFD
ncbi:hypothetical protein [Actinacidiphila epipremni]|uniref:Restriction endonuclease n=1 Tax=Actinacidiphila epipremni TaxID=2053013 RepID=A0ABX1A1S0_9ACTN|nr:hypothetical protein [Actinacidiphila epipremni]NJP47788.1 hypothetical protein [Actinacidiphila epipremni]